MARERLTANLQGVVDEVQTLGNTYVVCPSVDGSLTRDADGWRRVAATFNRLGDSLQRVGLQFAFHNHDGEFKPFANGELPYDILLAECDPKFVKMEMDLYWIIKGGQDPLARVVSTGVTSSRNAARPGSSTSWSNTIPRGRRSTTLP